MTMAQIFIREGREGTRRRAKTGVIATNRTTPHTSDATKKFLWFSSWFFASFAGKKGFQ
jgi:hypothetical protein